MSVPLGRKTFQSTVLLNFRVSCVPTFNVIDLKNKEKQNKKKS